MSEVIKIGRVLSMATDLASLGHSVFPLAPGTSVPLKGSKGFTSASSSIIDVKAWWSGSAGALRGVGLSTDHILPNGKYLVALDLDVKDGKDGVAGFKKLGFGDLLDKTVCQTTKSGGRHLLFTSSVAYRSGVNVLGIGIDVRAKGGYIKVYDLVVPSLDSYMELPEAIADMLTLHENRVPTTYEDDGQDNLSEAVKEPLKRFLEQYKAKKDGEGRNHSTYVLACILKNFGANISTTSDLVHNHWNTRNSPPLPKDVLDTTIRNAFKYSQGDKGVLAKEFEQDEDAAKALRDEFITTYTKSAYLTGEDLAKTEALRYAFYSYAERHLGAIASVNMEFAFIENEAIVMREDQKEGNCLVPKIMSVGAFKTAFGNRFKSIAKEDGTTSRISLPNLWLTHKDRRSYASVIFDPSVSGHIHRLYNLWRGFPIQPKDDPMHSAVTYWLEHIRTNIAMENEGARMRNSDGTFRTMSADDIQEWIVQWFAAIIQQPAKKAKSALVLRGRQGTGKNALVDPIKRILGSYAWIDTNPEALTQKHNDFFRRNLFYIWDEAACRDDKVLDSRLKELITADEIAIEPKGAPKQQITNYTRLCILGNNDWLIPASEDARRYACFKMGEKHMQDIDYFERMGNAFENDGYSALMGYLLKVDLSGFTWNSAPITRELSRQKMRSLNSVQSWWRNILSKAYENIGLLSEHNGAWVNVKDRKIAKDILWSDYRFVGRQEGRTLKEADFHSVMMDFIPDYDNPELDDGQMVLKIPKVLDLIKSFESRTHVRVRGD